VTWEAVADTTPEDVLFDPDRVAELAPAERRVAEFLEFGGQEALVLSAAAIADRVGTSDATVIRTAQALGYPGMGELRRALANRRPELRLEQRLRQTLTGTAANQLLARSITNHLAGLELLTESVTADRFEHAVAVLASGERVVWRSVGPSAGLAQYAQMLCERVGRPSVAWTQNGTSFAGELLTLRPTDVVAVLAHGRLQPHVLVLVDHASTVGAEVVLITDRRHPKVTDRVALVLESGRGMPGLFASQTSTLVLLEALVLGLAATDEPAATDSLARLNDLRAALAASRG
jgi:DNA-binding MurR/RpiR family transcriptional regulator